MDVVGSEIGQKMRSAIKAKLTELGCYVDDELPDYVMVMVANKRTRAQMEDDLQLFLGDNTELFVNWLHQVLKKLQEVTVPPLKEPEKIKEKVKEKKSKDKKDKDKIKLKKTETAKKSKKKDKDKEKLRKKEEKKAHKSKKKNKHHEIMRPNVPPLLMNIEKESEPSITDVFAGQILKNHGVVVDTPKEEKPEQKPIINDLKRPILPIIDPATISQPEVVDISTDAFDTDALQDNDPSISGAAPREEQIKEINDIEAKIQGLKQKLAEQLDSMSDDEDFLNIRTEAEELMNDFAEDVFQEISSQAPPVATPPLTSEKSPSPTPIPKSVESKELQRNEDPPEDTSKKLDPPKAQEPEVLPQIELKLPKRPVRERLGARQEKKSVEDSSAKEKESSTLKERKRTESPERFTPDREPDFWGKYKSSAKSRLGEPAGPVRKSPITAKKNSFSEDSDDSDTGSKKGRRVSSSSSERVRVSCASVVRVRPRPRVAPASSLLMRAVADAHKSLLNIPPKVDVDPSKIKRALVHPMRRCVDPQNIVIQVPSDRHSDGFEEKKHKADINRDEYVPSSLTKKITNTDYVPSRRADRSERADRTTSRRDDTLIIETINIHNTTVDKDKDTQFIVTMDGFNPNAFLAKKLKTEGLLDDEDIASKPKEPKHVSKPTKSVLKTAEAAEPKEVADDNKIENNNIEEKEKKEDRERKKDKENKQDKGKKQDKEKKQDNEKKQDKENVDKSVEKKNESPPKKRLSDTSDDSDTQVIIKPDESAEKAEKRKSTEVATKEDTKVEESPPVKKRKASPIVFNVAKKDKEDVERTRQRTESASSDNHVVVTTATNSHKYDTLPSLSQAEKKLVWCRSFPLCRYGALCAFQHPRCKFAAACTRRNCPYAHSGAAPAPSPPLRPPPIQQASAVVPTPNYKSISTAVPSVCKFYPSCVNPSCHFYHPKPCRYGKACANKLECNFYHIDVPAKWRYPV